MTTNAEAIPFLLETLAECERIKANGTNSHHSDAAIALDAGAKLVRDMHTAIRMLVDLQEMDEFLVVSVLNRAEATQ